MKTNLSPQNVTVAFVVEVVVKLDVDCVFLEHPKTHGPPGGPVYPVSHVQSDTLALPTGDLEFATQFVHGLTDQVPTDQVALNP